MAQRPSPLGTGVETSAVESVMIVVPVFLKSYLWRKSRLWKGNAHPHVNNTLNSMRNGMDQWNLATAYIQSRIYRSVTLSFVSCNLDKTFCVRTEYFPHTFLRSQKLDPARAR